MTEILYAPMGPDVPRELRAFADMARGMTSVDELLDTARADVDSGWLPSCQLAVARDGELVAFETFGDATNDTRYCIFSCTKPIVASAVWLLIGEGRLDPARRVADYIPEFAANGKERGDRRAGDAAHGGLPERRHERGRRRPTPSAGARDLRKMGSWSGSRARASSTTGRRRTGCSSTSSSGSAASTSATTSSSGSPRRSACRACSGSPRTSRPTSRRSSRSATVRSKSDRHRGCFAQPSRQCARRACPAPARSCAPPTSRSSTRACCTTRAVLWDAAVLDDAKTNVRCDFPDNLAPGPGQPHARARARGRRRAALHAVRQLRRRELAPVDRARGRAHARRLGRPRNRASRSRTARTGSTTT